MFKDYMINVDEEILSKAREGSYAAEAISSLRDNGVTDVENAVAASRS
jgi:hypothetical protein